MSRPVVVHISGAPGSGKTWLGHKLQRSYPQAVVFDTDLFIQHHTKGGQELQEADKELEIPEYDRLWRVILATEIQLFLEEHAEAPLIIFVGILDNWGSPEATFHLEAADYRFYIDLPLPLLCRRYYTRLSEQTEEYWEKVAAGEYTNAVASSDDLMKRAAFRRQWHQDGGYRMASLETIQTQMERLCERIFRQ